MRVLAFLFLVPTLASASPGSISDKIQKDPRFTLLRKLMKATGTDTTLGGDDFYTFFAPTDAALKKLPPAALQKILSEDRLGSQVVMAHLVRGHYGMLSFINGFSPVGQPLRHEFKTLGGYHLTTVSEEKGVTANGVKLKEELICDNGVILVVDDVLPIYVDPPRKEGLSQTLPKELWQWGLGRYYHAPKGFAPG